MIDHEQMQLQVHESVGHPTELDRVYGTEAAYAGTSFLHPGDLGTLRYGSEHMNITADPTTPRGLGTFGFDDEGVPATPVPIVSGGILSGFLTSRETAAQIGHGAGGSMRADGWQRMPLVRMTNLHLEPGSGTVEELISEVRRWAVPGDEPQLVDRRQAPQLPVRHADGLGDQARPARTPAARRDLHRRHPPVFWGSLDRVAGPEAWVMHGLTNCGKGQPGQSAHVSHGASAARFRDVQVGVKS